MFSPKQLTMLGFRVANYLASRCSTSVPGKLENSDSGNWSQSIQKLLLRVTGFSTDCVTEAWMYRTTSSTQTDHCPFVRTEHSSCLPVASVGTAFLRNTLFLICSYKNSSLPSRWLIYVLFGKAISWGKDNVLGIFWHRENFEHCDTQEFVELTLLGPGAHSDSKICLVLPLNSLQESSIVSYRKVGFNNDAILCYAIIL